MLCWPAPAGPHNDHPSVTSLHRSSGSPYRSFWMAGFEGADHVNGSGERLDMVALSGHDRHLDADYARLAALGIGTIRESVGWRLAEPCLPGRLRLASHDRFDFRRMVRFADAAARHGLQVMWSLMHYGTPDVVSLLDDSFCERFAEFAGAVARTLRPLSEGARIYTPINEISFLAWAIAETDLVLADGHEAAAKQRARAERRDLGYEVKCRLVRACLAAIEAIRAEDPQARFLHVEPLIHVSPAVDEKAGAALSTKTAADVSSWQWQAWDMLRGSLEPSLGGSAEALDLIGANYYHTCQWDLASGRRLEWHEHDPRRRPLASLLRVAAHRYGRPLIVAETSHVGSGRAEWLADVGSEVTRARDSGTDIQGVCLYPVIDRPDWSDTDQWHRSGLFDVSISDGRFERRLHLGYAKTLRRLQKSLPAPPAPVPHSANTSVMPHLIVYCHLRWNFVYQRPQHLLSRLARSYPVVFIEEPMCCDGEAWLERSSPAPGIEVLRPHTPVGAPGFHDDQLSVLEPMIASWLESEGIVDTMAWFYTPMALPLLNGLTPRAVIYDCMDELSAFRNAPRQMRQRETALLKRADLVLTGGPSLYEAKRHQHDRVMCLPSAVDAAHYAPANALAHGERVRRAAELQVNAAARGLGFFGVIDERLDIELVAALADADPTWQIVMVGPVVKIDPARLPQRPNLHWLGQQPYELLPQLVASWSVCLMPFALNESTRFISPTKTLEYMAAGKPVVSTPIHDVSVMFGELVAIAADTPSFIAACRVALAEDEAARAGREQAMAACVARHGWDETAATIVAAIGNTLADAGRAEAVNAALDAAAAEAANDTATAVAAGSR